MQITWDYTNLAKAYLKRPIYSPRAIDALFNIVKIPKKGLICDIGAGVGHLTIPLLEHGYKVVAIEPNDNMRNYGQEKTKNYHFVDWFKGTGEVTGQPTEKFDLVTFGSSFNVTNRILALKEAHRILKQEGWIACLWNHRNLNNPLQQRVEKIIKKYIPTYQYGTRREDQSDIILKNKLFNSLNVLKNEFIHEIEKSAWIEAWWSHATLIRQAKDQFNFIIKEIEQSISDYPSIIKVPYVTSMWIAKKCMPSQQYQKQ
ncbi:MAG: hypothetical protein A3F17_05455 [Gammaproteobacteria bacterium RIFCSPHIGHO2_12_FULL_41_15]|nr:MAG: hypothetical protein A3F17_05455 [Gammaproteobacteria bacterium RIFCSPHIGHO2_12_FULL_41_15]